MLEISHIKSHVFITDEVMNEWLYPFGWNEAEDLTRIKALTVALSERHLIEDADAWERHTLDDLV